MKTSVLLIGHGTVDDLDDLPAFLTAIRRGHPAPPPLVAEVRRRYQAIGGKSPLHEISGEVASKLETRMKIPVRLAMRMWRPYPRDVLEQLVDEGVSRVLVVPLAQHSAHVYAGAVQDAAREIADGHRGPIELASAANWGREPALTRAFATEIKRTLAETGASAGETFLLLTAHSLPLSVIRTGDPYEAEVRASAAAIADELAPGSPEVHVAFQSQGMGGGEWLGPDILASFDAARAGGHTRVVVAPIGFLADHVEILYDLDIEAKAMAAERGLSFARTRSLNASDGLVDALESVARRLLAQPSAPAAGIRG